MSSRVKFLKKKLFASMGAALVMMNNRKEPPKDRRAAFSSDECRKSIRISDQELDILANEFHDHRLQTKQRARFHISQRNIEIFLYYLAGGGFYRQTGLSYGLSTPAIWEICHEVASYFRTIAPNFIELPDVNELRNLVMGHIEGRQIILLLDGFIVPISRPAGAEDSYYCSRPGKNYDGICVQYFVDRNGKIRHIITGLPGTTHDKTAVEFSFTIMDYLNNLPPQYAILADSAYRGLHHKVKTLHRGQLNAAQRNFNDIAAPIRQLVERAIGASQVKWRIQQGKENRIPAFSGPIFPSKCTMAAAVLHNRFTNFI